jgi:DNA repair exonuclease SbcCD ATPase subunit
MEAAKKEVERQPDEAERAEEARPEFERVTEVLGPLEQIVLAADREIGSLQERVDAESGEVTSRIQSKVREAAVEQRGRVVKMRGELTDAATQLATRFETMLDILDQAERQLAIQAGEGPEQGMRVTLTERRRVTFSHEQTESAPAPSKAPPGLEVPAEPEAAKKRKGIRGWFRRRRG